MEENKIKTEDEFLSEPLDLPGEPDTQDWTSSMPSHSWHKAAYIIVAILAVIGGGAFAWMQYGSSSTPATSEETQEELAATEPEPPRTDDTATSPGEDVPAVTSTETLRTRTPRLEFTHPSSWKVSEAGGYVRVVSPEFRYSTSDGQVIENGTFRLHFRQGATEAESDYFGRGYAPLPSKPLTYTDPASEQRQDTNLSFFGLDTTNNFSYFLVAGNFSLDTGDTLGPDFASEADAYIISGGYASATATDGIGTNKVPLDYFDSTQAYEQALDIIKSLKII